MVEDELRNLWMAEDLLGPIELAIRMAWRAQRGGGPACPQRQGRGERRSGAGGGPGTPRGDSGAGDLSDEGGGGKWGMNIGGGDQTLPARSSGNPVPFEPAPPHF